MKRELRELIVLIFEGYLVRKNEHRLYDRDSAIPEQIISMYYQANEEPPFKILYNFILIKLNCWTYTSCEFKLSI